MAVHSERPERHGRHDRGARHVGHALLHRVGPRVTLCQRDAIRRRLWSAPFTAAPGHHTRPATPLVPATAGESDTWKLDTNDDKATWKLLAAPPEELPDWDAAGQARVVAGPLPCASSPHPPSAAASTLRAPAPWQAHIIETYVVPPLIVFGVCCLCACLKDMKEKAKRSRDATEAGVGIQPVGGAASSPLPDGAHDPSDTPSDSMLREPAPDLRV